MENGKITITINTDYFTGKTFSSSDNKTKIRRWIKIMKGNQTILPKTQITTTYDDNGNPITEIKEDYDNNKITITIPEYYLTGSTNKPTEKPQLPEGEYKILIYQTYTASTPLTQQPIHLIQMPFNLTFYHHDHLGTTRYITNENGEILHTTDTLAYGEELTAPYENEKDEVLNTITFTGHEKDYETNLTYMLARYYSQGYGRFLSPDPGYDYDQLDPMSWNLYSYVRGNPITHLDPTGMWNFGGLEELSKWQEKELERERRAAKARKRFEDNSGRSSIKNWSLGSTDSDDNNDSSGNMEQLEKPEDHPADGKYYTLTTSAGNTNVPQKLKDLWEPLKVLSIEGGIVYVLNPKSKKVYEFKYVAVGGGLGFEVGFGGASIELGEVNLDKLSDFKGSGVGVSFLITAVHGFSGQIYGAPWYGSYGISGGYCGGAGGGISALYMYTWGGKEVSDLSKIPQKVRQKIKSLLY